MTTATVTRSPGAPVAVRRTTAAVVVALVAAPAAAVSYLQMQRLATATGFGPLAWLLPLTVDGLMLAATLTLWVRHRDGRGGGPLAWSAVALAVAASLAANITAIDGGAVAHVIAGWPPVALLLAYELVVQQIRSTATASRGGSHRSARSGTAPAATSAPPAPAPAAKPAARSERVVPLAPVADSGVSARERIEEALAADPDIGTKALAQRLRVGESTVRKIKAERRSPATEEAVASGQ